MGTDLPPILQIPEPCGRCGQTLTVLRIRIGKVQACVTCWKAENKGARPRNER